jgi:hypothetical protein
MFYVAGCISGRKQISLFEATLLSVFGMKIQNPQYKG